MILKTNVSWDPTNIHKKEESSETWVAIAGRNSGSFFNKCKDLSNSNGEEEEYMDLYKKHSFWTKVSICPSHLSNQKDKAMLSPTRHNSLILIGESIAVRDHTIIEGVSILPLRLGMHQNCVL
jgi:hypothetical protein